jgi:predicted PurR-regulated permease PerM
MRGKPIPSIKKLQEDVKEVYRAVYQGNGKPAIITQLSELTGKMKSQHEQIETKILHVNEKIDGLEREIELKFKNVTDVVTEKFNNMSVQITSEFGRKRAENTNMWNFRTAITTASLASFTSVFVLLLAELLKRFHG